MQINSSLNVILENILLILFNLGVESFWGMCYYKFDKPSMLDYRERILEMLLTRMVWCPYQSWIQNWFWRREWGREAPDLLSLSYKMYMHAYTLQKQTSNNITKQIFNKCLVKIQQIYCNFSKRNWIELYSKITMLHTEITKHF